MALTEPRKGQNHITSVPSESELRRDVVTGRWVIINTSHPSRVGDFEFESADVKGTGTCPFCPGNEAMTPPEVYAERPSGGQPNGPGWTLRVVPNKFPALQIEGDLQRRGIGIFDMSRGVGAHEVIVESTNHQWQLADLDAPDIARTLHAYQLRSRELRGDQRLKYVLIFKNHGVAAGASLEHTHSQLIALPVVPIRVADELNGCAQHFEYRDRCAYCDVLHQELEARERVVCETSAFAVFAPYVSRFPYELCILPKFHRADFLLVPDDELQDLARALREALRRLRSALKNPAYNFILHTAPIEEGNREDYHWHFELMPTLRQVAGFEWGTGFYINPTPPELAAEDLRNASI